MRERARRRLAAAGAVALSAALLLSGCGSDSSSADSGSGDGTTFKVWWFEPDGNAMSTAWTKALDDFKAAHPDVDVQFELKSFDQIQQSGSMILNSDSAPDLMEYAKGSGTAGLAAQSGLLTDLTEASAERGWDAKIPANAAVVGHYDDRGVMGSGPLYGVPTYGEYVSVFYNKDLFAKYGLAPPTTLADFEAAMDTFVQNGITPLTVSAADYGANHLWYELALSQADRQWVDNFQLFAGPVDFHDQAWTFAAQTMQDWVTKGYISKDSTGIKATDMGNAFTSGAAPMMVSGSWWDGQLKSGVTGFEWGEFPFPGNELTAGSGGNIWVVPTAAQNKDFAYEFIDSTLSAENQNLMGNSGGVPIAADPGAVTDPVSKTATSTFNAIAAANGLAFYPDWPAPGYFDQQVKALQNLISGSSTPQEFNDAIAKPYQDYVAQLG